MTALHLRLIACACMLLDHIGYLWHLDELRTVGRLAFPIFLFLIYNGYRHTASKPRYALRLGLFALVSQIPFSLFSQDRLLVANGNVFFSLLLALLCIWAGDRLKEHPVGKFFCPAPALGVFCLYAGGYLRSDNGGRAILMAMALLLFYGPALWQKVLVTLGTLAAVCYGYFLRLGKALVLALLGAEFALPAAQRWEMLQLLALGALPLIFAYNGQKGSTPRSPLAAKAAQLGFYLFYPVHMLALWALAG